MTGRTNWAGNVTYGAARLHRPSSLDELRSLVVAAPRIRALGTGHSFNHLADSPGDQVSVAGLPPVVDLDRDRRTVTVSAGLRYGEVAARLHAAGHALHNLGSLPHISVAGACATGTHGSGSGNGNLTTAVVSMDLVTADGDLVTLRRGSDGFAAAAVGLGAFGVVTALTLDVEPTFDVAQHVFDGLPDDALAAHLLEILDAAYSVSVFTGWAGGNQVWLKRRLDGPAPVSLFGAVPATGPRHPIASMPAGNCTEQLGVPGPWHLRLPHFRPEFTPSSGDELQSEFFVPRASAAGVLAALNGLRERLAPVTQISEIRAVAADDLWLSPAYGRDSVAFHFTWISDAARVLPVVAAVERDLAPFDARPHWGKVFTADPAARYPRAAEWASLVRRADPGGRFGNDMLGPLYGYASSS